MPMSIDRDDSDAVALGMTSAAMIIRTAQVISSYVSHNHVSAADLPSAITALYATLNSIVGAKSAGPQKPAVPIKKSYGDNFLVCLEDGKRLTMLKRYLRTHHDLSPEQYRAKWGLPPDYPMVAPAYARLRSAFAKKIGLGTKAVSRSLRRKKK